MRVEGKVSRGACKAFTDEEVTTGHPVRQNIDNPSIHIADCARNLDNL
jgi:hypothetical protein